MILVERERLAKELWRQYDEIRNSLKSPSWVNFMNDYWKPKMVPIQRVIRAPKFKSYVYTPRAQITYIVADPENNEVKKVYLLTPPKTLY